MTEISYLAKIKKEDGSTYCYLEKMDREFQLAPRLSFIPIGTICKVTITTYDANKEEERLRTEKQNNYYHLILDVLCDDLGYDHLELHEELKMKFLGKPKVVADREVIYVPSTTQLNSKNFGTYLEKIHKWAIEELDTRLPEPNFIDNGKITNDQHTDGSVG